MPTALFAPLTLPGGAVLPNRVAKAAMEESMASTGQLPGHTLRELYRAWSAGGAGLLITGNVMVHDSAVTGPAAVVLDEHSPLEPFRQWADAAYSDGTKVWMQINHPGRQVTADLPGVAWAPSAVGVELGRTSRLFARPVAMTNQQIADTIDRFVTTARRAQDAGFDGVEIHAAHGYLLSQFLSPLSNKRTDEWGGSLENRARLLTRIAQEIRAAVRPEFAVAVKLNSADFQRGGFDTDDARAVIDMLAPLGVDLVELSGGSYESPAMTGRPADGRTQAREAYFLELAQDLATTSPVPLMLTGGILRRHVAEQVLAGRVDVVGMGTALAIDPQLPNKWRISATAKASPAPIRIADKAIASAASMARVREQLRRIARGRTPRSSKWPRLALAKETLRLVRDRRRYASWLHSRKQDPEARELNTTGGGAQAADLLR
ncbi:2,4-dienoyl-CoA reductase-like NADH-dependent reductase (Old Yellow Enzyme family) [Prauserella sediminis]|uniref:2,4-dienoyl-CoA reductase-like NADH-dependent reductase (Old Yellow Enzyme family) n=1 Tax=Prauserella sediminis TaxID=577680 RepID=A0A839XW20_9PSEU|nr:NADH:flavin oxidoreductase/NADH oxidase family protein [Prauserella sediminis]MBB3665258.1 2,4-dienoyl-CoA reductase-like NADH-dependent reductase (Old Yellow Enzyme family) [Prauserella sediminis]